MICNNPYAVVCSQKLVRNYRRNEKSNNTMGITVKKLYKVIALK